jgi:hypothetical protein
MAKGSLACQMGFPGADCTDPKEQKRRNESNSPKPWFKVPYTPDPASSYKKVPKKK